MTTTRTKGDGQPFSDVLKEERHRLGPAGRPTDHDSVDASEQVEGKVKRPAPVGPIGLALSGGGIRSATFSLGVLQALADRELLSRLDYLSTVSGGGYIGSWLSAWIYRTRASLEAQAKTSVDAQRMAPSVPARLLALKMVEAALARSAHRSLVEPPEVQWLRRYSNYLTPRIGVLSTDALTVVAIWFRNLFLNSVILVALTVAVLLLPILALPATEWMIAPITDGPLSPWIASNTWLPMLIGLFGGAMAIGRISTHLTLTSPKAVEAYKEWLEPNRVLKRLILPAFAAAIFGSIWLIGTDFSKAGLSVQLISFLGAHLFPSWGGVPAERYIYGIVYGVFALVILAGITSAYWMRALRLNRAAGGADPLQKGDRATYAVALVGTFVVAILLLEYWTSIWNLYLQGPQSLLSLTRAAVVVPMLTFGPPLMMFAFGIVGSLWVGFVGRAYQEPSREWWARMNGWHIFIGFVWLLVFLLTFYVTPLLAYVHQHWGSWATAIGGTTWLGSLVGAYLGKNLRTQPDSPAGHWKGVVLNIATAIVAVGIFVGLAAALGYVLASIVHAPPYNGESLGDYIDQFFGTIDAIVNNGDWRSVLIAESMLILAVLLLAWRVDINKFSLHNMYKNRLIRCYLGATNADRRPQPFTGFDPADDIALKDLGDQRPFQIINTSMNLTQGKELAWQQRKAASFVLTPAYCGFDLSDQQGDQGVRSVNWRAFRRTDQYATKDPGREDQGFSLGMAMATSGAAASPNMGFQSTPALAVIMTFFNVRLGRWSPNPIGNAWQKASPGCGLMYLLAELAGSTNEESDFVYLSDGGHFENTGAYELIRRKCAVILMVDAGADPDRTFADLANLQRKVRVDFGFEITLSLDQLRRVDGGNLPTAGFEVGTVHYASSESVGRIILIKPAMCANRTESADLQNYLAEHEDFPQQTTSDQWFDESQFESYRKLGFELGSACLKQHSSYLAPIPTGPVTD